MPFRLRNVAVVGTVAMAAGLACGKASAPDGGSTAAIGTGSGGGGGTTVMGCPAGTLEVGGKCQEAGIPPEACGKGFEADGQRGCRAILPAMPCATGTMAIPGETMCREVAPCGQGPYADDVPAGALYVDAAATSEGNGSKASPFKDLQMALIAAELKQTIALAAGKYGSVIITAPVALHGRCPAMVEIGGVSLLMGADGASVSRASITGSGITVDRAHDVLFDRVHVHDAAFAVSIFGAGSATLTRSLLEGVPGSKDPTPAVTFGERFDLAETVLRGVAVFTGTETMGSALMPKVGISRSVLERVEANALVLLDGEATVEDSVLRDTTSSVGSSMAIYVGRAELSPKLTLRRSIIDSAGFGVMSVGADVSMEHSVIRHTSAMASNKSRAIELQPSGAAQGTLSVRSSLLEDVREMALYATAGTVTVESTIVRSVAPANGLFGDGLAALSRDLPTKMTVRGSRISGAGRAGVSAFGAEVTVSGTVLECNAIDLDGESSYGFNEQGVDKTFMHAFAFTDGGGNACGCKGASHPCATKSSQLHPPDPNAVPKK